MVRYFKSLHQKCFFRISQSQLAKASIEQYCKLLGYQLQTHKITTQDGYILSFHRIQKQDSSQNKHLRPVYIQHGLLDSSFNFITNEPNKSPGLFLADQGFDVWLGNSRGNHFSLEHQNFNYKLDNQYWNFSWQEMIRYDLPAAFQYISDTTNQGKVDYIGHSQGTTIMFGALAEEDKIVTKTLGNFIAMGPVTFVTNAEIPGLKFTKQIDMLPFLKYLNIFHLPMPSVNVSSALEWLCLKFPSGAQIINQLIANSHPDTDNIDRFPVFMAHYPSTTSVRVLEHWQQMLKNKDPCQMTKFDFGSPEKNMEQYNSKTPPLYDLAKIKHRVHLLAGIYDKIADITDVRLLHSILPNSELHEIKAGHATFIWSKDFSFFKDIALPILTSKQELKSQ